MGNTETCLDTTYELKTPSEYLGHVWHIDNLLSSVWKSPNTHKNDLTNVSCHKYVYIYIPSRHTYRWIGLVIRMDECVRSNHTQEWFDEYVSNMNV